jgi:hypothetical protein
MERNQAIKITNYSIKNIAAQHQVEPWEEKIGWKPLSSKK